MEAAAKPLRLSLEDTAAFFRVSVPTLRGWIANGCPVAQRGGHGVAYELDPAAVHDWRLAEQQAEEAAAAEKEKATSQLRLELLGGDALGDDSDGALSPRAKAELLKAELHKIEIAKARGQLVRADDMRVALAGAFAKVRDRLRALPDRLAARHGWGEPQVQATLADIDETLTDLASEIGHMTGEGESDPAGA